MGFLFGGFVGQVQDVLMIAQKYKDNKSRMILEWAIHEAFHDKGDDLMFFIIQRITGANKMTVEKVLSGEWK